PLPLGLFRRRAWFLAHARHHGGSDLRCHRLPLHLPADEVLPPGPDRVAGLPALGSVLVRGDYRLRLVHAVLAYRRNNQPARRGRADGRAAGAAAGLRRGADGDDLPGHALHDSGTLPGFGAARSDAAGSRAHPGSLAATRLLRHHRAGAQEYDHGDAHHGLRLRARLLPSAADPWPAAALDALGAYHRPGDLPVQHALRCRHGRLPRAHLAGAGGTDPACRLAAGGDMSARLLKFFGFAVVAVFMAMPLAVVAGVSVNEKQSLTFPPEGFSVAWYGQIFTDPGWRAALGASVLLAALSAALAVLIALPLSWFLWRRIAPWANVFRLLGVAPFILPPVITALGLLTFWATLGFYGQPWTAVIS